MNQQQEKEQTIREMLSRYEQARSSAGSSTGDGAGGRFESRINTFDPLTWTPEYRELERCLLRLRWLAEHGRPMIAKGVSASRAWWHLRHRYLEARVVRREVHLDENHRRTNRRPRLAGNMEVVSRQTVLQGRSSMMLVRVWDSRVDAAVVDAAVSWLACEFRGMPAVYSETAA